MLVAKAGKSVARELELWVYYHYFSDRFDDAIRLWWIVLNYTETVPDCLDPMIDKIEELDLVEINAEIREVAAKYYNEHNFQSMPMNKKTHYSPYFANHHILEKAYTKNKIMSIFQVCAQSLNQEEIKSIVEWAKEYVVSKSLGEYSELCEDELITTKALFSDFPSILDLNI